MEDLSQTAARDNSRNLLRGTARDEIAARRGISLNTYDNHWKAACRKLRDSMMAVVDFSTDIDLPDWYDRIEEMNKRHAARQRRRASTQERETFQLRRRPFQLRRRPSNSRGDAD